MPKAPHGLTILTFCSFYIITICEYPLAFLFDNQYNEN